MPNGTVRYSPHEIEAMRLNQYYAELAADSKKRYGAEANRRSSALVGEAADGPRAGYEPQQVIGCKGAYKRRALRPHN